MVGVAGRSKGCITCRKRKKGCDLQQPECGQCKERGTPCGGYDTDRMFVHESGYRRPTKAAGTSQTLRGTGVGVVRSQQPQRTPSETQLIAVGNASRSQSPRLPTLLDLYDPTGLFLSAYRERSMESFMEMYKPRGNMRSTKNEGMDVANMMPQLSNYDEALRLAVLALGTVALSKQTNNTDLAQQGRSMYGKALVETRRALQDPVRARSTPILAIPHVMALYEILFGAEANTSKQAQSWLSHAEGEIALIVARGPEAFTDGIAHSIFLNARYRPLIAAARTRKRSVLNEEKWKTIPWRNHVKTPNDTLLDIMAGVPEVLENVDRHGALSPGTPQDEARDLETCAKCWTLHIQLQEWLSNNEHEIHTPVTTTPTPIRFPSLEIACLTIRYWVLALLLYSTLDTASRIPTTDPECTHHDRPHPRYFARLIARASPYFFQHEFGISGPTTISFPLGNALLYMRRDPVLDADYLALIKKTWNNPNLPSAIKAFLTSLRLSVTQSTK